MHIRLLNTASRPGAMLLIFPLNKKNMRKLILSLACALAAGSAVAAELGVLVAAQPAASLATPDGTSTAPVLERLRGGPLHASLQQEAQRGATAQVLALDELAMQVAGQPKGVTWLLLSQEEGGFARQGFWLKEGDATRWVNEPMVDLVVNQGSIDDGSFEEIFAHELGHVMLRRLAPNLPPGYSRTPHHSFSITDQPTAFDEGWATHFQPLARRLTVNPRLRTSDEGFDTRPFLPLWQSNLDGAARIQGVRQNWFVHRKGTPEGKGDAVERQELSTMFDRARLRNGAQMLASEGVVATFFYRHLAAAAPQGYEPMFRALRELSRQPLAPDTPLVPALAAALAKVAPEDGKRFVHTLMETSYGALASPQLARATEALAVPGRAGDAEAFVPALKDARLQFAKALEAAQADPSSLAAQAGPAVWLLHPTHKLGGEALAIDLNTAEREHLMTLPGVDADRALASRAKDGYFTSVSDFARRTGLKAAASAQLEAMHQAMLKAGSYSRQ